MTIESTDTTTVSTHRSAYRDERVKIVNEIIAEIASRGRKFFANSKTGNIAKLEDKGRKIFYRSEHTVSLRPVFCLDVKHMPHAFPHGMTLYCLLKEFSEYIRNGKPLHLVESGLSSPHWGYPEEDLAAIRKFAHEAGYLTSLS